MEPFSIVVAFASIASGVALARIIAEYRQSNRELRRIAIRGRRVHPALARFRAAADMLRRRPDY